MCIVHCQPGAESEALCELLGRIEGLLERSVLRRQRNIRNEEQSRMPDGSEFQILKPREAKVVRTRGTDNRLVLEECRKKLNDDDDDNNDDDDEHVDSDASGGVILCVQYNRLVVNSRGWKTYCSVYGDVLEISLFQRVPVVTSG